MIDVLTLWVAVGGWGHDLFYLLYFLTLLKWNDGVCVPLSERSRKINSRSSITLAESYIYNLQLIDSSFPSKTQFRQHLRSKRPHFLGSPKHFCPSAYCE